MAGSIHPSGWVISLTRHGTPRAMVPGGTLNPSGTSAPAPTSAPSPTMARLRVTDPDPMRHRSPTTQPSRWVLWPTTHSVPMTVGQSWVQCTTVPS